MTDDARKNEREALIAGDRVGALTPDEVAELSLLADLLADPSTWAEPDPALEELTLHAVETAAPMPEKRRANASRRRRTGAWTAGVAAAVAVALAAALTLGGGADHPSFKGQLAATALAPGAHASTDVYRNNAGFHFTFDASGLARLPSGEFYQAWLKNPSGTLVALGTFSSSDGRVTLWSGVSPKDFPTMSVTIEATDNDQASSGRVVLVGQVRAN